MEQHSKTHWGKHIFQREYSCRVVLLLYSVLYLFLLLQSVFVARYGGANMKYFRCYWVVSSTSYLFLNRSHVLNRGGT